jgi:hypothetical protein
MPEKTVRPAKRWFGMRPWFVIILATLFILPGWFYLRDYLLTYYLPYPGRIEVELVHIQFETIDRVIAEKTLAGPEADRLTSHWRQQHYHLFSLSTVKCHEPAYRIRFYKFGLLLTEATVCFHCHNIYFYRYPGTLTSEQYHEVIFGVDDEMRNEDEQIKALAAYLASLFPGHDVETESTQRLPSFPSTTWEREGM